MWNSIDFIEYDRAAFGHSLINLSHEVIGNRTTSIFICQTFLKARLDQIKLSVSFLIRSFRILAPPSAHFIICSFQKSPVAILRFGRIDFAQAQDLVTIEFCRRSMLGTRDDQSLLSQIFSRHMKSQLRLSRSEMSVDEDWLTGSDMLHRFFGLLVHIISLDYLSRFQFLLITFQFF